MGDRGPQGEQGEQGLRGIQGERGPTGPQGERGATGKTAYEHATENGYSGTEAEFNKELSRRSVKTINYAAPGSDGNVNIKGGSGIKLIKSDTVEWDGNSEGRTVATNTVDPSYWYVHVSDVVPTLEELQKGGSFAVVESDGSVTEETFEASGFKVEGNLIEGPWRYFLIAKEGGTPTADGTGCVLPKAGIYFAQFDDGTYVSRLTINDYDISTKLVLRFESGTVESDDIVHGGYVKVSDAIPSEEDVRKGGTITHYNVVNGNISGDLIVGDYLGGDYSIAVKDEGITIRYGAEFLVIISRNGSSTIGGVTFNGITSPGVYFKQSGYSCVHSLTINDYTGFSYDLEKIPAELIPDGIGGGGGGVSSWHDLTDKPFGETTVMGDTLTWDGNTDGLTPIGDIMYHISDVIPTVEDLQNGGILTVNIGGELMSVPFTVDIIIPMGENCVSVMLEGMPFVVIAMSDSIDLGNGMILPKSGVYFLHMEGEMTVASLTLNGYAKFEATEIKTIDKKYLPKESQLNLPSLNLTHIGSISVTPFQTELSETDFEVLSDAYNNGLIRITFNLTVSFENGSFEDSTFYNVPAFVYRDSSGFVISTILYGAVGINISVWDNRTADVRARILV
jgi:hypothetical protein